MTYIPTFQRQLNPADPLGPQSCVAYAMAMMVDAATDGAMRPTGAGIRAATGDKNGGLELSQCSTVVKRDYDLLPTTGVFNRAIFEERMASGLWAAVLIGGYRPIGASSYSGEPGGVFNHAVGVLPANIVMDPLADGRRAGIYKFHGASYPLELIREFAADLRLSNGSLAGNDHFEATLFPLPNAPKPQVRVAAPNGKFDTYTVHATGPGGVGGRLRSIGHTTRTLTVGSVISCSVREYVVFVGTTQRLMRQLTSGEFAGLWVIAHGALRYSQ